jgi:ribose transport system ATP-binding protein
MMASYDDAAGVTSPLLAVAGLTKRFGPSTVLNGVSFEIARHKVIGLVGENGAGKSTLLNLLSGMLRQDAGEMFLHGRTYQPNGYKAACQLGIGRAFQEQALILNVPVYENLVLGHEARFLLGGVFLNRKAMIAVAEKMIREAEIDVDVRRMTGDYDVSRRQAIEIVRACQVSHYLTGIEDPLILLDEPTSALAKDQEEAFFRLVDQVKAVGSVLFVSHRLSEVLAICDLIHVLKDGRLVATVKARETNETTLHGLMVGRERVEDYYHESRGEPAKNPPFLEVRGLSRPGFYRDVSFQVRPGEIVGIGGLLGSGKSALGKGVVGLEAPLSGAVKIAGQSADKPEIRRLIRGGIAYVPPERLTEGLIAQFRLSWNVSMASGHDLFSTRLGRWLAAKEEAVTNKYIDALSIKSGTARITCDQLSGGNQQKVVLSRWLCREPKMLVLDNPTRGIDVGAKEEIYRLIRRLTDEGMCVLLITDELLELIGVSNRIIIMQMGQVVAELDAPAEAKPTENDLVALMLPATRYSGAHSRN